MTLMMTDDIVFDKRQDILLYKCMRSRKTIKICLITLAILAGMFLAVYYLFGPSIRFESGKVILEKGQTYLAEDFISAYNGQIEMEDHYLNTSEVGEYDHHFEVRKWFMKKDVTLHYEVVDTTPPVIEIVSRDIVIDPDEEYGRREILENIIINEGNINIDTDLDTGSAGTYTVNIAAVDEYGNTSYDSYEVTVSDREAPFIFRSGEGTIIKRGTAFNINDHISYGDNMDPHPVLEVKGTVNTGRIGNYTIHASLTDASGNSVSWSFTVSVVNRIDEDEDDDYHYPFDEFRKDYAGSSRMFGVDVSEWQDVIDFERLKNAGCEFVMMRIGYAHNGELRLDQSFRDNIQGAKSVGLPAGIYYYSYDKSEEELLSSLRQIFAELGDTQLELPIVFDWERFSDYQDYGMSFAMLNHLYDVFEEEVKAHGYVPMLYGSKYYLEKVWRKRDVRTVWLAHYVNSSSYQEPYLMWQVSDRGMIDGIDTYVDFDIMFTDE